MPGAMIDANAKRVVLPAAVALFLALAACTVVDPADQASTEALRFSVTEGRIQNEFLRQGPVAAHLVLTSGPDPRLVVAFPAGNSGTALWFEHASTAVTWQPEITMSPARRDLPEGLLQGIRAELDLVGAPLTVKHAILGSVRVIRDYGYTGDTPPEVLAAPVVEGNSVVWQRSRLDGGAGYYLAIEVLDGTVTGGGEGAISFLPDGDGALRFAVTALTGDTPLTALHEDGLLTDAAGLDSQLRRTLAFLSYEEKLLAGSWRFNTYFGRDTLMTLQLLMPVLQAPLAEAGLGAVLDRLSPTGEVAHEEDIGEFAVLRRLRNGEPAGDAPIFDYKMIDDDFLLPIVAARYFLATAAGRAGAAEFFARRTNSSESNGAALLRNFAFVVASAEAFARDPRWQNLVALKSGEHAGNWRDSEDGLGGGRIPYDVNAVLLPAALQAIDAFRESGMLQSYVDAESAEAMANAGALADLWLREAPRLFDVSMPATSARAEVAAYAERIGVQASSAAAAIPDSGVMFRAIALDGQGRPIPVLHSDEGFALLFLDLPAAEVEHIVATLMRPFPAGLMTDVGPVVATPAFAGDALEPAFGRGRYHGTTIWSWQQAMLSAGIARQLERSDLAPAARHVLEQAAARLACALVEAHAIRGSELWSWSESGGRFRVEPFGQRQGDETESNAAQLWSTVHLASPQQCADDPGTP